VAKSQNPQVEKRYLGHLAARPLLPTANGIGAHADHDLKNIFKGAAMRAAGLSDNPDRKEGSLPACSRTSPRYKTPL